MAKPKKAKKDKLTGRAQQKYFLVKANETRNITKVKLEQALEKLKIDSVDLEYDPYDMDYKKFVAMVEKIRNNDYIVVMEYNDYSDDPEQGQTGILIHKDDEHKVAKRHEMHRHKFRFLKASEEEIDRLETSLVFTTAEDAEKLLNDFKTFCKTWLEQSNG